MAKEIVCNVSCMWWVLVWFGFCFVFLVGMNDGFEIESAEFGYQLDITEWDTEIKVAACFLIRILRDC